MIKQAHIYFSGRVQGVGFRYTMMNFARGISLKGWVKNLPDGRVEALVEGEQKLIEELCHRIEEHFKGSIRDKEMTFEESEGSLKEFKIVY